MSLIFSKSESERFNLKIYRCDQIPANIHDFLEDAIEKRADLIIMRITAPEAYKFNNIISAHASTLLTDVSLIFEKPLNKRTIAATYHSKMEIFRADQSHSTILSDIVHRCYHKYLNHYAMNPCLDSTKVLDGLIEYSLGFLTASDDKSRGTLLAKIGDKYCGYLSLELIDGVGSTVIGGAAMDEPDLIRHKILSDLTHCGDRLLLEWGAVRFKAQTKIDNFYTQKLLSKYMHSSPVEASITVHINLFLNKTSEHYTSQFQIPDSGELWPKLYKINPDLSSLNFFISNNNTGKIQSLKLIQPEFERTGYFILTDIDNHIITGFGYFN